MKRVGLVLMLLGILLVPLFAAAQKADTASGPVTVNHWYWVPNADIPRYTEMIDEFNKTHTDVQVAWENVPQRDVRTKFITAYQVGEGPDSFAMQEPWVMEFVSMNMLEPLDSYLAQWKGRNEILSNLWGSANFNSNQWALPWKLLVTYMYYRADWFKELGLQPPQNMDEFVKVSKALTGQYTNEDGQAVDRYGFGLRGGGGNAYAYYIWAQSYGAKLYDENGKAAYNSPIAVEATQKYVDLYQKEKVVPPSVVGDGFAEVVGAFKSGRTAMFNHHIGTYIEISRALGDKAGVMLFPAGPAGYRWSEASIINHGISSISNRKQAAFAFISWMSEDWAVEHQSRYLGSVPITKKVSEIPYFAQNQFYKMSSESIKHVGFWPKTPGWGAIIDTLTTKLLQQALMGQITAQEMVRQINEALEKDIPLK
jgi:multiple sugar transport system substrate-binding protein